jgi:hypothetical protein
VIKAVVILMVDDFIPGVEVDGFWVGLDLQSGSLQL